MSTDLLDAPFSLADIAPAADDTPRPLAAAPPSSPPPPPPTVTTGGDTPADDPQPARSAAVEIWVGSTVDLTDDSPVVITHFGAAGCTLTPTEARTFAADLLVKAAAAEAHARLAAWHRKNAGLTDAQLAPLLRAMHAATQG